MTWVPSAARAPNRCLITRRGDVDAPFLDLGLDFFQSIRGDDGKLAVHPKLQRLYLSARGLMAACNEPGSPIVALDRAEHEARSDDLAGALAERDAANLRAEELEAELENFRRYAAAPLDGNALASMLAPALDERYAHKTGPKKARA